MIEIIIVNIYGVLMDFNVKLLYGYDDKNFIILNECRKVKISF